MLESRFCQDLHQCILSELPVAARTAGSDTDGAFFSPPDWLDDVELAGECTCHRSFSGPV